MSQRNDPNGFVKNAFYTITSTATGSTLSLTFNLPSDATAVGGNASRSEVILAKPGEIKNPLDKKNDSQLWHIDWDSAADAYRIYAKISDKEGDRPGYIVRIGEVSSNFSEPEDHKHHDKYNRNVIGIHTSQNKDYWYLTKVKDGKYRIVNALGTDRYMRKEEKAKGVTSRDGWFELRSLASYKAKNGKIYLRHEPTAEVESQYWTVTKSGF